MAAAGQGSGIGTGDDDRPGAAGERADGDGVLPFEELPVDVDAVLTAVRLSEPGSDYGSAAADGRSGAYRYSDEQWAGYAGYDDASAAPPAVQDARARADVQRLLGDLDGNLAAVAGQWFLASVAGTDWWQQYDADHSMSLDLFVRAFTDTYRSVVAHDDAAHPDAGDPEAGDPGDVAAPSGASGDTGPVVVAGPTLTSSDPAAASRSDPRAAPPQPSGHGAGAMRSIAFPVLGPVDYYPGWNDCREVDCSRRHEGVDILGVRMQPLLAAVDGTISAVGYRGSELSGHGVTITAADGWHYNYFHVNNDNPGSDDGRGDLVWQYPPGLSVGDHVEAGQIIGYMGDSGNSEGSVPHVHFEIRDPSGAPRDPYWSLQAAERRQACTIGLGPWSNPVDIGPPSEGVAYTAVTPLYGNGVWYIDSQGRVTAIGDAALIEPSRGLGCAAGPEIPYGSDAAGWS